MSKNRIAQLHADVTTGRMRPMLYFAALYLSFAFLRLSNGSLGHSMHFWGLNFPYHLTDRLSGICTFHRLFIGCWWAPNLMGTVGHSRAFAAFTATGTMGILAHMLFIDAYLSANFHVGLGLCISGC